MEVPAGVLAALAMKGYEEWAAELACPVCESVECTETCPAALAFAEKEERFAFEVFGEGVGL